MGIVGNERHLMAKLIQAPRRLIFASGDLFLLGNREEEKKLRLCGGIFPISPLYITLATEIGMQFYFFISVFKSPWYLNLVPKGDSLSSCVPCNAASLTTVHACMCTGEVKHEMQIVIQ